jgi:prepilin-type N-terminal cleavage/methylation domain-containing protein
MKTHNGSIEEWKAGRLTGQSANLPVFHPSIRRSGFTLLEVLLAVTLLAIIVTVVYSLWNTALRGWKAGIATSANAQRERLVLEVLSDLTQSLVFYNSTPDLYQVVGTHDETVGDTVSFVTGSDVLLPATEELAAGMRRVTLAMQQDSDGRYFLAMANTPAVQLTDGAPEPEWHAVSHDVSGFLCRYRDPRDGSWKDEWRDSILAPSALEYTLVFWDRARVTEPVVVTRAIDVPAAEFAAIAAGQRPMTQNTTNEVRLREVDLSQLHESE